MTWDTRPVLGLDVDGVLALADLPSASGDWHDVSSAGFWRRTIFVPTSAAESIARLAADFDIVWVTAWGHTAHTTLAPVLDLPDRPWPFLPVQFGKAKTLATWAGPRPWVLVHDGMDTQVSAEEAQHIVTVDPRRGLDFGDVPAIFERLEHQDATKSSSSHGSRKNETRGKA